MKLQSLIIIISICLVSCNQSKQRSVEKTNRIEKSEDIEKTNFASINNYLLALLDDVDSIKKHLSLSSKEAQTIVKKDNRSRKLSKNEEEKLIDKLVKQIGDTTKIITLDNQYTSVIKGDLALLGIYKVRKFPFAKALRSQWCTGDAISNEIHLPYNLVSYTDFKREKVKASYIEYLSNERINIDNK